MFKTSLARTHLVARGSEAREGVIEWAAGSDPGSVGITQGRSGDDKAEAGMGAGACNACPTQVHPSNTKWTEPAMKHGTGKMGN